jgi:hypothetical protein
LEPEQKIEFSKFTDREKVKFKKELLIYLFFLVISVVLWYLIALSKDYTTTINYPVTYNNFPKGKVLVSDLPEELGLEVKGFGFTILKHKIFSFFYPITLPINKFRLDILRKDNQYDYFLLTRYAKDWIGNQLGTEIQVVEIKPDTLVFKFTDVVEKKVAVKPMLNLLFEKQYLSFENIKVKPDSIVVSGPEIMVDTLNFVYTKELKLKNVKDSVVKELELLPIKKFSFQTDKVMVTVPVEKYTEKVLNLPIEADNVPETYDIKTFPGSIKLSCWVGISNYDKLAPFMFRVTVDYNTLSTNSQSKLKVNLVKFPHNIQNIKFNPKSVDYIIEK